jgi:hypothetical protein
MDVLHVVPTDKGWLHVDHAYGACEIGKTGDVVSIYTPAAAFHVTRDGGSQTARRKTQGQ